jgi:hypothetical protein
MWLAHATISHSGSHDKKGPDAHASSIAVFPGHNDAEEWTERVNIVYSRVAEAPERFKKLKPPEPAKLAD